MEISFHQFQQMDELIRRKIQELKKKILLRISRLKYHKMQVLQKSNEC